MPELDIEAIRERALLYERALLDAYFAEPEEARGAAAAIMKRDFAHACRDRVALLAEVRRLRADNAELGEDVEILSNTLATLNDLGVEFEKRCLAVLGERYDPKGDSVGDQVLAEVEEKAALLEDAAEANESAAAALRKAAAFGEEVERLREALHAAEQHMTGRGAYGCVCKCPVIDGHTGDCVVIAALNLKEAADGR